MLPAQLEFSPVAATVYAIALYGFMWWIAGIFIKQRQFAQVLTAPSARYGTLDGVRGILATGVFVHHTFAIYGYFTTGVWQWSASPVFNQLGQTTVALFFMITGFLFTLKALKPRVDWQQLYLSRLLRLVPLYAVVVSVIFAVVFYASDWVLQESIWEIVKEYAIWLTFVCFGRPDVNAYPMTWTLIANVNWSLKYEVLFYLFAVPAIHVLGRWVAVRYALGLALSLLAAVLAFRWYRGGEGGISLYTAQFLGGVIVAYAFSLERYRTWFSSKPLRVVAGMAALSLFALQYAYSAWAIVANVLMFAALVGGVSLWGLLNTRRAIWLGDISYGLYLLHGLVLWLVLNALQKLGVLQHLDVWQYGAIMLGAAGMIVGLASLSYRFLEKPAMQYATPRRAAPRPVLATS